MLNIRKFIAVSVTLLFLYSCSTSSECPTSIIQVSSDYDISCSNDSTLYEFSELFSFHSDVADGFVKRIDRMLFANHRIYVVDREANKVAVYDEDGVFLKSTSQYIGNASDEYIRLMDATTDGKYIYVCCDAPYKILIFDKELNPVESIALDMYLDEIACDGKYLYGIRPCEENTGAHELVAYKLDRLNDAPISVLPPTPSVRGRKIMGKNLTCADGQIYVSMPFDTNLYIIMNGRIASRYKLDFGEAGLSDNSFPQDISPEKFDASYDKTVWGVVNLNVSDSLYLFNSNLGHTYVIRRCDMSSGGHITILNDDFPIFASGIVPSVGSGHEVRFILNEILVGALLKEYDKNVQKMPILKEIKRRFEQDGGPLIAVWKIK